ncbi:MAG: hypothetical protein ACPGUF_01860 [Litorivicinus sp.]
MFKLGGLILLILVGSNAATVAALGLTPTVLCKTTPTVIYLDSAGDAVDPAGSAPGCDCWQRGLAFAGAPDSVVPQVKVQTAVGMALDRFPVLPRMAVLWRAHGPPSYSV